MALKIYVCNRWKSLQIGKDIRFAEGEFATDDPVLQSLVERNNAWGVQIHYKDSEEEMARQGRLKQEEEAAEKARAIQQHLDEEAAQEKARKKEEDAERAKVIAETRAFNERSRIERAAKKAGKKQEAPSGENSN